MALQKQKVKLTERGSIKNHVFHGLDKVKDIWNRMGDEVIVYFDPDVDGVVAGYLVCKFCAKHGKRFSWYINSNRSHDWTIPTDSVSGKDIIAVDFIITAEKIGELVNAGCNIISMDHHKNGSKLIEFDNGIVINNQYPFEEEDCRYLSGTGVVFETLIQLDPEFDTLLNRQLVASALLSDIRDIENLLAEGYLYKLYSAKYDGFIRYLIDATLGEKDFGFGLPRMDRNFVDFKFSPAINACLRFNQQDEVVNFILGGSKLNLYWRDQQKALVRELSQAINVIELNHLRVCYFYEKDFLKDADVLSNFVGLSASQQLNNDKSVICYMIAYNGDVPYIKRASFRGRINGLDYNKALSDLFLCLGHGSAFGIKGLIPNKSTFIKADKICGDVEDNSGYKRKIIEVNNMSMFVGKNAYQIAEDNMYKLSQNQVVIRYKGKNIRRKRQGANYIEYEVDGIPVLCFDLKNTFEENLITPVLDRGMLTFYLE